MIPAWAFYLLFALVAVIAVVIFGVLIWLASATGVTPQEIEKNAQNLKVTVIVMAVLILIVGAGGASIAIWQRAKAEDKKKQQAETFQKFTEGTPVYAGAPPPSFPPFSAPTTFVPA